LEKLKERDQVKVMLKTASKKDNNAFRAEITRRRKKYLARKQKELGFKPAPPPGIPPMQMASRVVYMPASPRDPDSPTRYPDDEKGADAEKSESSSVISLSYHFSNDDDADAPPEPEAPPPLSEDDS
jgi:hypothetical protein